MGAALAWLSHVGSDVRAQQLRHTGLAAVRLVGPSRTGDQTCVPRIGRRILIRCPTREVLKIGFVSVLF